MGGDVGAVGRPGPGSDFLAGEVHLYEGAGLGDAEAVDEFGHGGQVDLEDGEAVGHSVISQGCVGGLAGWAVVGVEEVDLRGRGPLVQRAGVTRSEGEVGAGDS